MLAVFDSIVSFVTRLFYKPGQPLKVRLRLGKVGSDPTPYKRHSPTWYCSAPVEMQVPYKISYQDEGGTIEEIQLVTDKGKLTPLGSAYVTKMFVHSVSVLDEISKTID
jgi:hypothetical protein